MGSPVLSPPSPIPPRVTRCFFPWGCGSLQVTPCGCVCFAEPGAPGKLGGHHPLKNFEKTFCQIYLGNLESMQGHKEENNSYL